jgi:hypothetical protein
MQSWSASFFRLIDRPWLAYDRRKALLWVDQRGIYRDCLQLLAGAARVSPQPRGCGATEPTVHACVLARDPQDLDAIVTEGRADFREATIVRSVDTGHFASSQEVLTLRFLCRAYSVGLSHRPPHRERSRMRVLDVLHGER